jgi:type VI secretion system protein ImpM
MKLDVAESAWTLFGKVPARGDFILLGRRGEDVTALESWLTSAVEQAHGVLPAGAVRFVMRTPSASNHVMGTWVPSQDTVGRAFPLVAFRALPVELSAAPWSALFPLYDDLLDGLELTLAAVRDGDREPSDALVGLREPHASAIPSVLHEGYTAMEGEQVTAFAQRVFEPAHARALPYALQTLRRLRDQELSEFIFDAPTNEDFDVFVWLELMRAVWGSRKTPSVLWAPHGGHALLMAPESSTSAIAYLLNASHASSQRWPLWTNRDDAIERAAAELSPDIALIMENDASIGALREALARDVFPGLNCEASS